MFVETASRLLAKDILLDHMFTDVDRCKIITIMHSIWSSRNRWTHDKDGYELVQAMKWVHETLALLELLESWKKNMVNQC